MIFSTGILDVFEFQFFFQNKIITTHHCGWFWLDFARTFLFSNIIRRKQTSFTLLQLIVVFFLKQKKIILNFRYLYKIQTKMNGLFTCGFLPVHHSAETSANTAILSPFLNEIRSYKRHQKEETKKQKFL